MGEIAYTRKQREPQEPRKRYLLDFRAGAKPGKKPPAYGSNISGLAIAGRTLFCASDETSSIERLEFDERTGSFRSHTSHPLGKLFPALATARKEADIEGLAIDGGYLWVTGSHSLKRSVPEPAQSLEEFSAPGWDVKRALLGRVPLTTAKGGTPVLAASVRESGGKRHAAMMDIGIGPEGGLRGILKKDPLIGPFVGLSSKENGLDVEGLAVSADRVVLGLRGPVLGSHAFVVVLSLKEDTGMLVPQEVDGKPYRLVALHLGGLGIRDLLFDNGRLYILSGPTQKIESLQRIFAVDDFFDQPEVVPVENTRLLMTLPVTGWGDHAEGIAFFKEKSRVRLLVAYDSASPDRWDEDKDRLVVDAFNLPG